MTQKLLTLSRIMLFYLKRNKWAIIFWLVGLVALTLMIPQSFANLYPDQQALAPLFEMFKNPAMEAMLGKFSLDQMNIATMFSYEMLMFTVILVSIMNILFVSKDSRGDEEAGRLALLTALPVGRATLILSTIIQQGLINLILGVSITIGLMFTGIDHFTVEGAWLYGMIIAVSGFMISMLALLVAQFTTTQSQTTGISISLLLVMYLLRAIGDVSASWLSYIVPLGWVTRADIYSHNHWWPVTALCVTSVVLMLLAMVVNGQRDMESGLLPTFKGHRRLSLLLKSPFGLQLRLQRTGIIVWAIGMLMLGLSYGSVFGDLESFFKDNPLLQRMLTGKGNNYAEQFVPILMAIMGMVSTIPVLMAIFKIQKEIKLSHTESVLALPIHRTRYFMSFIWIGLINSFLMISLAALGMYIGAVSSMDKAIAFHKIITAGLVFVPAILVFAGLAVCIVGWFKKGSLLVYLYLAYSFLVVYLGQLLNIKQWLKKVTPFGHVPRLPIADMDWSATIIMLVIALILFISGIVGFKYKDIS
ncbi:ABC transporter permease [Staphylococcus simulans]|uniref:ABC transporter permease n=1 Tax=Staphylococcus simulans TaxID=1286 RepID=UPI000D1E8CF9|nr:ABC transporter permease subunit [Staphylococcus simulans]MDY5060983.1 ABC transporter permease [Staphylococcus simulans]PTJ18949.1 ABC transporter permease [Staphylococcus simulans]